MLASALLLGGGADGGRQHERWVEVGHRSARGEEHKGLYLVTALVGLHQLPTRCFALWHFVLRTKQSSSNDRLIFR